MKHGPAQSVAHGLVHLGFGLANRRQTRNHLVETCLRNDHDTILVRYDDIAAGYRMTAEGDVEADRTGAALAGELGVTPMQ